MRKAYIQAMAAPQSWPTRCGRLTPSSMVSATMSLTIVCMPYASTSCGLPESPKPRRSGAMTRKPPSTSAGIWCRHR